MFDEHDLAEIDSPDFPGERLVCCRNPALAEQVPVNAKSCWPPPINSWRIAKATRRARRPLRGQDKIGLRVGKVLKRYKIAKHLHMTITDDTFAFTRINEAIAAEAALDGIYVIRTSLPTATLLRDDFVLRYKGIEDVERFFRTLNSELDVPHPPPAR